MHSRELWIHLFRLCCCGAVLIGVDHFAVKAVASAAVFFSTFFLLHDAMHSAIGLGRRANHLVLALAGMLLGLSGHAARALHLRHHLDPLGDDDLEGRGARGTLLQAFFAGFGTLLRVPTTGWAYGHVRDRWMQPPEWVAACGFVAITALTETGRMYLLFVLFAQLTIQIWASFLPHRPPPLLMRAAQALIWTRSSLLAGFVFHELHHARPGLSSFALAALGAKGRGAVRSDVSRAVPTQRSRRPERLRCAGHAVF